jgi:ArsR family transcriptional regulator, arsenate/arsenite/antimonite-responsive transcriptional repressor
MLNPESFFKALSDATRLRCLLLLASEGRLCVCELVEALDLSQPLISRHLGQLRALGIVLDERRGQWVHYRLHPELPAWSRQVLKTTARDASMAGALERARRRLQAMKIRPSLACA